jgi:vancomycin aglycone glucosyltransferase
MQPLVALALHLRACGHTAQLVGPPDFAAWIEREGFHYTSVGSHFGAFMERANNSALALSSQSLPEITKQFSLSPELAKHADVVIAGIGAMAAPSYAEKWNKPFRLLLPAAAYLPSRHWPAQTIASQGLPAWLNAASWWATGLGLDLTFGTKLNAARRRLALPPVASAWGNAMRAQVWLAADPALGPAEAIDPRIKVEQLGAFFLPESPQALPVALETFLQKPAIAITFGSMPSKQGARLLSILSAATAKAGVRAVVVSGWAKLPSVTADEHVLVVPEVSFAALFPRVTAVVHHGGAGTLTLATMAGKAQLVVPHIFDNFYWAKRLLALGVAPPPLPIKALNADRLAARLRALTPEMTARAEALAPGIRRDGVARAERALTLLS